MSRNEHFHAARRGMPREKGVMTHAQMMKKQRELA
jgi:hypothetical protein